MRFPLFHHDSDRLYFTRSEMRPCITSGKNIMRLTVQGVKSLSVPLCRSVLPWRWAFAAIASILFLAGAAIAADPLVGNWQVESVSIRISDTKREEFPNPKARSPGPPSGSINFTAEKFVLRVGSQVLADVSYVSDSAQAPCTIDTKSPDGAMLGIYVRDGDQLKISLNDEAEGRPSDFDKEKCGMALVLRRSPAPPRLRPPTIDGPAAGDKALEQFDADKDGKLSGAELDKCPGLKAALAQVDATGQGVTAKAIAARIKAWQDSKLGRMSIACTVLHDGKPLDGANVRFMPETFLGENVQAASGKTDKNGVAMISIATSGANDPPGVAPGFYRVEITKSGEEVPAKYNSATTLGQEIALDAAGIQEGIKFNLKY
jgi:hypothetical protein